MVSAFFLNNLLFMLSLAILNHPLSFVVDSVLPLWRCPM